jgi:hypothetical protein
LIDTEGRGGAAEIEIETERLRVVDEFSAADRPASPARLTNARLDVVVDPRRTCRIAPEATFRKGFKAEHGWRYRAHGEIVSTQPLCADVGPLRLALERDDPETWEVGDRISLAIDRIALVRVTG